MTDSLQKYLAEFLGTFTLVFIGTTGILACTGEVGAKNITMGSRSASRCWPGSMPSQTCPAATSTRACRSRCSSTGGSNCRT